MKQPFGLIDPVLHMFHLHISLAFQLWPVGFVRPPPGRSTDCVCAIVGLCVHPIEIASK